MKRVYELTRKEGDKTTQTMLFSSYEKALRHLNYWARELDLCLLDLTQDRVDIGKYAITSSASGVQLTVFPQHIF